MRDAIAGRGRTRPLGWIAWGTACAVALASFAGISSGLLAPAAQDPAAEIALEGTILGVNPAAGTINVMGVAVQVPAGTPITTATASIGLADLLGASFTGRTTSGFVGGAAIVNGTATAGGGVVATDVFVEVAENVLFGPVTANTIPSGGSLGAAGTTFSILGVEVRPTGDARLPLVSTINGLPLNVSTVPVGGLAGAEGYLGSDGILYAHTLEAEAGQPAGNPNQTGITLARCKPTGRLEVRGTSTTPGTVSLFGVTEPVEFDPVAGSGTWRIRIDTPNVPGGVCPTSVTVQNSNGSSATAAVTIQP